MNRRPSERHVLRGAAATGAADYPADYPSCPADHEKLPMCNNVSIPTPRRGDSMESPRSDSGAHTQQGSYQAQVTLWRSPADLSPAQLAAADIICEREHDNVENGVAVYYDRDGRELDTEYDTVAVPATQAAEPEGSLGTVSATRTCHSRDRRDR